MNMILSALAIAGVICSASTAQPPAATGFVCNDQGYLRQWVIVGPNGVPYAGPGGSDDAKRRAAMDQTIIQPPKNVELNQPGPFEQKWSFYYPGQNYFVECSHFYHKLTTLDYYAATDACVAKDCTLGANFWAAGSADLWVNGEHICRFDSPRYMYPAFTAVKLPLKAGANRLYVRLQGLGVRDTRMLFGLQLLDGRQDVTLRIPGPAEATEQLIRAADWLDGVCASGREALASPLPAPANVDVKVAEKTLRWPAGEKQFRLPSSDAFSMIVSVKAAGQKLSRPLEIPANKPATPPTVATLAQQKQRHLEYIASHPSGRDVTGVIARRQLKQNKPDLDEAAFKYAFDAIATRKDCADFSLAMLLRLHALGLASEQESQQIKKAALAFRYWTDEPGSDAMCFGSENHSLLFHGCQMLAGKFWPDEVFTNSGRKGSEQAVLGARRCEAWLDHVEKVGFSEYLSSTYMPLTLAAMLNLVDFSGDAAMAKRSAAMSDRLFENLALQAFDGVTICPQGRVYRNVLYPQSSGTQALLSLASLDAATAWNNWLAFPATSKYTTPANLSGLMRQPASKCYRQAEVEICIHKTGDYLLTSLQIPASFESGGKIHGLRPGDGGYQQHLWQASLGGDCQVFVNHPGASFDMSESRPGYWYGNGSIPRLSQSRGVLQAIFDIPQQHPIPFTHASWPSDAFDRQEVRGQWAFGMKGSGCVALWCSQPLTPHNEMLTGRELRATGRRVAWVCICASAKETGGFDRFVESCRKLAPAFDSATMEIRMASRDGMKWQTGK